jgi:hypothetical protein
MKSLLSIAAAIMLFVAPEARAAIELNSFSVSSHAAGPGLLVNSAPISGPTTLAINNAGDSVVVDLFRLWTNETSVNFGEDTVAKGISVNFNFKFGAEAFAGLVNGQTAGIAGVFLFVPFGAGIVDWASPVDVTFGTTGKLRIEFLDQLFNADLGFGDLSPGQAKGATVKAKFTLLSNGALPVEPGELHAPEPATLLVWTGLGVAALATAYQRRRSA